jgi:ubiquinone biosynthesis protein COQ4
MTENMGSRISDADFAYYNGSGVAAVTESSVLVSSSPYLNSAPLRELIAQEMLRRNGADLPMTSYIPDVAKIFMELEDWPKIFQLFEEEKARLPEFKKWLDGRKISLFKPEELAGAKPGTLRFAIHDFTMNLGYNMDHFYQGMEIKTDFDFYMKERTHSHDIEHMITGLEANHAGEIALISANMRAMYKYFTPELAAFFNRISAYLKAKTTMKSALFYPEAFKIELEAEDFGAQQGKAWKYPLFLVPFRDYLDWQISDIREELGIKNPPKAGIWAWTNSVANDAEPPAPVSQAAE